MVGLMGFAGVLWEWVERGRGNRKWKKRASDKKNKGMTGYIKKREWVGWTIIL